MATIQLRRGDAADWTDANSVLAEGEVGLELDTGKFKFGDGSTAWNDLAYIGANIFHLTRHALLFTETIGAGIYTAELVLPPGASLLDVAVFCLSDGPWNGDSAVLSVYDSVIGPDTPYIDALDLVAVLNQVYDPLTLQDAGANQQWADPATMGTNVLKYTTSLYAETAGGASSVRFPNGGTVTAVVTTTGDYATGGIAASQLAPGTDLIGASHVDPAAAGESYAANDTGSITGGNGDGRYKILTVDGDGEVLTYEITNPGTGYSVGSAATALLTGDGDGSFVIVITSVGPPGGSGYAAGDTGNFGTATYVVDSVDGGGAVLTYTITDPGSGYSVGNTPVNATSTGAGDGHFAIVVSELEVSVPGNLVVDLIGFGVPPGSDAAVKS